MKEWKILLADDSNEEFKIFEMVFEDFQYCGKKTQFFHAKNADEAKRMLSDNEDLAVVLLDENLHGLQSITDIVAFIRDFLNNYKIRIIVRSKNPVILEKNKKVFEYDINEYTTNTQVTVEHLHNIIMAALKSFDESNQFFMYENGFKLILDHTNDFLYYETKSELYQNILELVTKIINNKNVKYMIYDESHLKTLFFMDIDRNFREINIDDASSIIGESEVKKVFQCEHNLIIDGNTVQMNFKYDNDCIHIYVMNFEEFNEIERQLFWILESNLRLILKSFLSRYEMNETQEELLYTLGDVIETRSVETANHTTRVAHLSEILALKLGINEKRSKLLKITSAIHDIGKIGIRDEILNKTGKLSFLEYEEVKKHSEIGYEILRDTEEEILMVAANIARFHHERWDGKGYPIGLKGEEIDMFSRIVSLIDVYDALSHKRIYKEAWNHDAVVAYILENKGKMFDPEIVDVFMENIEEIKEVNNMYTE
ncbi:MAG: HD-GYP domain-containing protein [Clostridiales bacterium]|nr:HD-GYP domain-containing protein [Clostridiales bacterium]